MKVAKAKESNFIRVKIEAVVGFAGDAYLPAEFQLVRYFIQEGMRGLGMLKKPAGKIPVWVQDGKFAMNIIPPPKKPYTPTLKELQKCEKELLKGLASSTDGVSSKAKATRANSRAKKKRSKTRASTSAQKKPSS